MEAHTSKQTGYDEPGPLSTFEERNRALQSARTNTAATVGASIHARSVTAPSETKDGPSSPIRQPALAAKDAPPQRNPPGSPRYPAYRAGGLSGPFHK